MVSDSAAEHPVGRPPIYLVGDPTASEALADELAGEHGPVEAHPSDTPESFDPPARGVVCLPPGGADRSLSDIVARTADGFNCPVAAVGADVDARAAYQAGATEVVPLSPAERATLVADRVTAVVDRDGSTRADPKGTDSDSELVDALSAAFPDYAFVYSRST